MKALEEEIRVWLGNGKDGISDNPLMLHGTSIEALFELFSTGKLPTGIRHKKPVNIKDNPKSHIYFVPVLEEFKGTPSYDEIKKTMAFYQEDSSLLNLENVIFRSKDYAQNIAQASYVLSEIGGTATAEIKTCIVSLLGVGDLEDKKYEKKLMGDLMNELSKQKIRLSKRKIKDYMMKSENRQGVLIEPNEKILELPYNFDPIDLYVRINCPRGLSKDYIKGIKLLGQFEIDAVQNYLAGRETQVNGFKSL